MKQRFYLSEDYAILLATRATAAGVPVDVYLQSLIAHDQICGGAIVASAPTPPAPAAASIAPAPVADTGISLGGDWGTL